jgi:hypothetical protein
MPAIRFAMRIVCGCTLAGILGCSPPVTEVSGTIKINGQPPKMAGLEISFIAPDGRPASTTINPDGTYESKEVPAGTVQVCFVYMPEVKAIDAGGKPRMAKPGKGDTPLKGAANDQAKNPIPMALRESSTSKISTNLVSGQKNVFNYDIKP